MNENMKPQGAGAMLGSASREKYWEELDQADKIERLRDELAHIFMLVNKQSKLIAHLMSHGHSADGNIVVPLTDKMQAMNYPSYNFSHDYGPPHRLRNERERR